jgi:predicted nucleic acid-binding protein
MRGAANVLVDTGPLAAWLNARDAYHGWAKRQFDRLRPPLTTCEAVLSEVVFLLHRLGESGAAVPLLIERGVLQVAPVLNTEAPAIVALMRKYADTPMSLADACLVRLSELVPHAVVFTVDADFGLYRRRGRSAIPLLMPDTA